jgi:hypothetical protein
LRYLGATGTKYRVVPAGVATVRVFFTSGRLFFTRVGFARAWAPFNTKRAKCHRQKHRQNSFFKAKGERQAQCGGRGFRSIYKKKPRGGARAKPLIPDACAVPGVIPIGLVSLKRVVLFPRAGRAKQKHALASAGEVRCCQGRAASTGGRAFLPALACSARAPSPLIFLEPFLAWLRKGGSGES